MDAKILVMRPNRECSIRDVLFKEDQPTYNELNAIIRPLLDGGDLERINVFTDFEREALQIPSGREVYLDMFVDDVGKFKMLPVNDKATAIYRNNALKHMKPTPALADMPKVYGTAILFNRRVWF